jgi:Maltose acetyltransferase
MPGLETWAGGLSLTVLLGCCRRLASAILRRRIVPARRGIPLTVVHMVANGKSMWQRMLAGELYIADDPELARDAMRARTLTHRMNKMTPTT